MTWALMIAAWGLILLLLAGILKLPLVLDLYILNRYFVISRAHLLVALAIFGFVPLAVFTIHKLRSLHA
jgi:hypothetical protein